jgi:hypothetical protein
MKTHEKIFHSIAISRRIDWNPSRGPEIGQKSKNKCPPKKQGPLGSASIVPPFGCARKVTSKVQQAAAHVTVVGLGVIAI